MASIPQAPGPGDAPQSFSQDEVTSGLQAGRAYSDLMGQAVAEGHDTPPPRPDLGSIYSDAPLEQSSFQAPSWDDILGPSGPIQFSEGDVPTPTAPSVDDLSTPSRDAINEGAGPIGEAIVMGGAGITAGLVKGAVGAAAPAVENAGLSAADALASRLQRLSQLSSENTVGGPMESGHFFQRVLEGMQSNPNVRDLVQTTTEGMRVPLLTNSDLAQLGNALGSKWVRYPIAAGVGSAALQPDKSGF